MSQTRLLHWMIRHHHEHSLFFTQSSMFRLQVLFLALTITIIWNKAFLSCGTYGEWVFNLARNTDLILN